MTRFLASFQEGDRDQHAHDLESPLSAWLSGTVFSIVHLARGIIHGSSSCCVCTSNTKEGDVAGLTGEGDDLEASLIPPSSHHHHHHHHHQHHHNQNYHHALIVSTINFVCIRFLMCLCLHREPRSRSQLCRTRTLCVSFRCSPSVVCHCVVRLAPSTCRPSQYIYTCP